MDLRKQPGLFLGVTLLAAIFRSNLAFAVMPEPGPACSRLLKAPSPDEFASRHGFPTAIEADAKNSILLDDFLVRDQGDYGCCWISSTSAYFERKLFDLYGKAIPLSDNYQNLITLFYRIEEGLFFGEEVSAGGWQETANWMFTNAGIYPVSGGWKPKIDLKAPGVADEFLKVLNEKIFDYQSRLKNMHARSATSLEAWEFTVKKRSELYEFLRETVGNPPSTFVLEADGKTYTPNSFARLIAPAGEVIKISAYIPEEPRAALRTASAIVDAIQKENSLFTLFPETKALSLPTKDVVDDVKKRVVANRLYSRSHTGTFFEEISKPLKEIHEKIADALRSGETVFLSSPMVRAYVDGSTGVMSLRAKGATAEDAKSAVISGAHAMLITGAYLDKTGVLLGYRVQNSYGEGSGRLGYYYMDVDYFDSFIKNVKFSKRMPAPVKPAETKIKYEGSAKFVPKMKPKPKSPAKEP